MTVLRATGPLRAFADAGVLGPADVHVAQRLQALAREDDPGVLVAAALAVRAVRTGATCLELDRMREVGVEDDDGGPVDLSGLPWPEPGALLTALRRSPLVVGSDRGTLRPLHLLEDGGPALLYLDRYWRQEQAVRAALDDRARTRPTVDVDALQARLDALFPGPAPDRQRVAAALAATRWTTVLAGGPGTGKTTTVARVLALLDRPGLRVALAAPTGKAAARLQEAVRAQAGDLGLPAGTTASTLHRLLGWRRDSRSRFRHSSSNRLPYDLVVVDETSMLSLTMTARLLEAVRPDARLVLVGDPDQLTSVDAGAVLADVVARPVPVHADPLLARLVGADLDPSADDPQEAALSPLERDRLAGGVVRLSRGRRFGGAIAELAVAVRDGDADRALALLRAGGPLSLVDPDDTTALAVDVAAASHALVQAAQAGDAAEALRRLEAHVLLCAHRRGPYGVTRWARLAAEWAGAADARPGEWPAGTPLLVTRNDPDAQVWNGDTGVVVRAGEQLLAAFGRGAEPVLVPPGRLADVQAVRALTIHRSQGSQYDAVSVLLPPTASALLSRELLYTAVTRARRSVRVLATEESLRAAVGRQVQRASGLRRVG